MAKGKHPESGVHQPHDKFFKEALSRLDIAKDYIAVFLPSSLTSKLNLEKLQLTKDSYLSEDLYKSFSDIVYTCSYGQEGRKITIALLFEHKSSPDPYIRLQLLRYMLNTWEAQRNNKIPLTPIIPLVFYHGERKWHKRPFSSLFKRADEELKKYLPEWDYLLTDVSQYPIEHIQSLNAGLLINTLLAYKLRYDEAAIKANFHLLLQTGDKPEHRNFIVTIFVYLISVTDITLENLNQMLVQIPETIKPEIMTTYDRLIAKGREQGLEQGLEQGREEGKIQGAYLKTIQSIDKMHKEGFPIDVIARVLEVEESFVQTVISR